MKIGFLGAGNMGGAIAKAVKKAGEYEILLCDTDGEKARLLAQEIGAKAASLEDLSGADVIFLAVKPQVLPFALRKLLPLVKGAPLYVSMAAGVPLAILTETVRSEKVIRIMPNTPVSVGLGMTVYAKGKAVSKADEEAFLAVMQKSGVVLPLPEDKIDAASAVSGCGPAFACLFAEALADGGVAEGLPRDTALQLAAQTVLGAAAMVLETGVHPAVLKDQVTSPGGTTIRGLEKLAERGFAGTVLQAVRSASARSAELGKK
jgi:pyrroline-5-carboxylate reductase